MVGTLLDPNYLAFVTPTIISPNYMFCTVTIAMSVTKLGLPISDGFVDFAGILDLQLSSIGSEIVLFHTDAYTVPYVGVYTINMQYDWSGPSTLTRTFTFTVIDPCIAAVVPPPTIPNSSFYVGDPDEV
jgi:hypothetical protein